MPAEDTGLIRFLQRECARLQEDNERLTDELRANRRYIHALQRLQATVQQFTPQHHVLALLDETLYCALELLDSDDGSVMLVNDETDELVFVIVHGAAREMALGYHFDRHEGIAGWVADHAEPALVGNVRDDARFYPALDEQFGFQTVSLVAVPLIARGIVYGVVEVINKAGGEPFSEDDASLLAILATLSASALDHAATALAME